MVSLRPACVFGLMLLAVASQAFAQTPVMKQFSQFSGGGQGLYWVPSSGPISHVAFLATGKADGIVVLDAHPGNTVNGLRSLNAAVIKEDNPEKSLSKKLDPFDPKNGFNPTGDSIYSDRFVKHYTDEQSERMNDLIRDALKMRADIAAGKILPTGDDAFIVYRDSARLSDFSTGVWKGTLRPAKLLKNDGTIDASQVVNTVRVSNPGNKETDESFDGAMFLTLTSFLSANSIRSRNSLDEID